jgi:hypothetical protein
MTQGWVTGVPAARGRSSLSASTVKVCEAIPLKAFSLWCGYGEGGIPAHRGGAVCVLAPYNNLILVRQSLLALTMCRMGDGLDCWALEFGDSNIEAAIQLLGNCKNLVRQFLFPLRADDDQDGGGAG